MSDIARNIRLKRVYDPPSDDDGLRILATRYWPRGVERNTIDEYAVALAPSRELLHQFRQGQLDWQRYRQQYLHEMNSEHARAEIHRLAKLARSGLLTILCVCADEDRCHRSLLMELVVGFDGG